MSVDASVAQQESILLSGDGDAVWGVGGGFASEPLTLTPTLTLTLTLSL